MIGYLFLIIGLGIVLGWLFPLISGIVRIRKRTGGKKRLIWGGVWGVLALLFIIYSSILAKSIQKQYQAEDFNPAAYQEGNLGKITLPFKGESSITLRDQKSEKQIRFKTSDGFFQAPPGEYSLSSWIGTLTFTDKNKSSWTKSTSHYNYTSQEKRIFSVTSGSSTELNDAVFNCFNSTPELKITTKPDPKKKGNTGIGLTTAVGDVDLTYSKDGKPLEAAIEIKAEDGKVVHKGTARIDKFSFG